MSNTEALLDNYYELFDIDMTADAATIERTIRTERKRWRQLTGSPDRDRAQNAERRMAQLEAAESTLLDDAARARYDAALSAQLSAPRTAPAPAPTTDWAERARDYYQAGDIRNAFTAAKKGTDVTPENNLAWYYYVQTAIELKRLEEADFASSELVQRTPQLDVSHDLRGSVLDLMGRYREAEISFRSAARIEPGSAYYHGRAAWAVLDQGQIDKAVEEATALVARFPDDDYPLKVLRAAADKLRERKQPQQALDVAQKLIALKATDENILEAVLAIQEIEKHVNVDIALAEAWRLLDAFPHNAKAQRVVRYAIGGLRERDRDAEALAEARKLLARVPNDQDTKALFARCRLTDAEESMSATRPGSYIILNKAQVAYYEAALTEVGSLDIADASIRAEIARKREYLAQQTKTHVKLSLGKILLALLAIVLFFVGLGSLPGGFPLLIIAGLLGWLFYATVFKKQYQLNYKMASPEVRARGIQK